MLRLVYLFKISLLLGLWLLSHITQADVITTPTKIFDGHPSGLVYSVRFLPDGETILSGGSQSIKTWNRDTGVEIHTFSGDIVVINNVAISPDGSTAASGGMEGVIKIWDVATGVKQFNLGGSGNTANALAFAPDGQSLLSGGQHQGAYTLKLWDLATQTATLTFSGHTGTVVAVAFAPDGQTILSGAMDNTVKLWNANTGAEIRTLTEHTSYVDAVAFAPDGQTFLSGSLDGTLKLWNSSTGELIHTVSNAHIGGVYSAVFAADGQTVLSGGLDGNAKLWNVSTGELLHTFQDGNMVLDVAIAPDGQSILSGSMSTAVKLWEVPQPAFSCQNVTQIPVAECESLIELYDSTDGDNWTDNTGWKETNEPCGWHGITCQSGKVTQLNLSENNLIGTLSTTLNNLSELTNLNLISNQITGTLPEFNLPKLERLYLYNNQFSGLIPDFNTPNLVVLNMRNNALEGAIPEFNFPQLTSLALNSNQLTGTVPNFDFAQLTFLDLRQNQLTGSLPNLNLPELTSLYLAGNQISGVIPQLTLPKLEILHLYDNQLSGTIPQFNFLNLTSVNLNNNQLTEAIPNLTHLSQLEALYISGNQLCRSPTTDYGQWQTQADAYPPCEFTCTTVTQIPQSECESLIELYDSTDGDNWTNNTGWKETDEPCGWYGVSCSGGSVRTLNLPNNKLNGSIPDFSNLPNLTRIYFYDNQLNGLIPDFSNLPNLNYLNLRQNQLSGSIPDFSNLPNLSHLELHNNQLSGSIPDFSNLPSLSWLNLHNNQLSGSIPDFSNLPNLTNLYLFSNQLSGSIPDFSNLPNLTRLFLSINQLSGLVPDFTNLPNLNDLNLGHNKLSGSIPDFSNPSNLSVLNLYSNQLSGSIPDFSNLPSLSELNLHSNQLSGSIPDFSNLPNLSELNLYNNQLSGSIPDFSNLPNLNQLSLSINQLSGLVPDFSNLPNLNQFSLSNNQLSGSIPDFSHLTKLTEFYIENNQLCRAPTTNYGKWQTQAEEYPLCEAFTCTTITQIPQTECEALVSLYDNTNGDNWTNNTDWKQTDTPCSWYGVTCDNGSVYSINLNNNQLTEQLPGLNLPNLTSLYLAENQMTGEIPEFDLPKLNTLNLYDNQLSGPIPNFNTPNLTQLNLRNNALTSSLPEFNFPTLEILALDNNQLSGTIPNFNFPELTNLSLHQNQFSGVIPDFNFPKLTALYLSDNQLTGSIPNFNAPKLEIFFAHTNQLTGTIPNFNFPELNVLHLSDNQLSGAIPQFNLPKLQHLSLQNNALTSSIPNFSMPELSILNLSNNQLSDLIPEFNFPKLTKLYLNNNQLSGAIPEFSFPELTLLYLHHNQLSGSIPDFNLPELSVLHLSDNQFTGSIPNFDKLSKLTGLHLHNNALTDTIPAFNKADLSILNVSNNQLTGTIPDFTLPILTKLYLYNNELTGSIPQFDFPNLTNLHLQNNQLTEEIPSFTHLSQLGALDVSGNQVCRSDTTDYGKWLPHVSQYAVCGTFSCTTVTQIPQSECETLIALYDNTNGDNWTNNIGWKQTNNPCTEWYNVACKDGHVSDITLENNNLNGSLPDLSTLTELEALPIGNNPNLTGSFPDISTLSKLYHLSLGQTNISGSLPANLVNASSLRELGVSETPLSGSLPNFSLLTNLTELNLGNSQFSGAIPALPTGLTLLNLTGNYLCRDPATDYGSYNEVNAFPACNDLSYGKVLHLTFDKTTENTSNYIQESTANKVTFVSGVKNQAAYFNGTDAYIKITDSNSLDTDTSMTIAFWLKAGALDNADAGDWIITKWCSSGAVCTPDYTPKGDWIIRTGRPQEPETSDDLLFAVQNYPEYPDAISIMRVNEVAFTGQWQHIAVTFNQGTMTVYVNGVLAQQINTSVPHISLEEYASDDIYIGQVWNLDPIYAFEGALDELVIYNRALAESEIQQLFADVGGFSCADVTQIPQAECESLVELYDSTDGDNWTNNSGWKETEEPCGWFGVSCSSGSVSRINLPSNQLNGSIPDFSNLPNLTGLNLFTNQLSGSIPDFSNLPKLNALQLHNNQLSGSIPDFSNLPNLTDLSLQYNQLNGSIPDFSNLPNLTGLNLFTNQLSGSIPDFSNLPKLNALQLHNNQLSGSIPDFSNLPNLSTFTPANNKLSGSIPDFSNLPNLYMLSLSYNELDSKIPDFSNLPKLGVLDLSNNQLSGEVPDFSNFSSLFYLDLSNNQLCRSPNIDYGSGQTQANEYPLCEESICTNVTQIPQAECETLIALYDNTNGDNWINNTGWKQTDTPCSWYQVKCTDGKVTKLSLEQNNLIGTLPDLSGLSHLVDLRLFSNELTGDIPNNALPQLEILYLNDNQFSGNIPAIGALIELKEIYLSYNQLTGTIPDLSTLTKVEKIDFSGNQLDGSIPNLDNLINLKNLGLSANQLSGEIPSLVNLVNLQLLTLTGNKDLCRDLSTDYAGHTEVNAFSICVTTGNPAITLLTPANGAIQVPVSGYDFTWSPNTEATAHRIVISTQADFANFTDSGSDSICNDDTTCVTQAFLIADPQRYTAYNLQPNTTYYWKVRSNVNSSYWSEVFSFTTDAAPITGCNGGESLPSTLCDGLTAYYPMRGNANDASGNGDDGVVYDATLSVDRHGNENSAYAFNGVDQYISIADSPQVDFARGQDFTIISWLQVASEQPFADSNDNDIIEKWSGQGGYSYVIRYINQNSGSHGRLQSARYDGDNAAGTYSTSQLNDGQFHQIAFIKQADKIRFYVDGVLESEQDDTITGDTTNDSPLFLGRRGHATLSQFFKGNIDELLIYNRGLTEGEVALYYNTTKPATTGCNGDVQLPDNLCDGLVAYYPFVGNADDASGNGNNGVVNGAVLSTDRHGNENNAYQFDGENDWIEAIDSASLNLPHDAVTVSAWISVDSFPETGKWNAVLSKGTAEEADAYDVQINRHYSLFISTEKQIHFAHTPTGSQTNPELEPQKWVHIAVVANTDNGGQDIYYLNGQEVFRETNLSFTALQANDSPLYIGRTKTMRFFHGKIDEIAIHNRTLSPEEIQTIYAATKPTTGCNGDIQLPENQCDGLVAYYPFNGDADDESGNGYDGVVNGATLSVDRHGNANHAYFFNGNGNATDSIEIPHTTINGLTDITTSVWIKTTEAAGAILSSANNELDNEYIVYINGGKVQQYIKETEFSEGIVNDGQWHHVVVVREGNFGLTQIFVDGNLVGSNNLPTGALSVSSGGLWIGREQDCLGGCFEAYQDFYGTIDDLAIYNRVLSESEVEDLYNTTKPTPTGCNGTTQLPDNLCQDLVAYYLFNNNANDVSGNGHNGIVNGAVAAVDRQGVANQAYWFDDAYIEVSDSDGLDFTHNFTIGVWVNPEDQATGGIILNKENAYEFELTPDNEVRYALKTSDASWQWISTGIIIPQNTWSFLTFSYDNGLFKLYKNGVLEFQRSESGSIQIKDTPLGMGARFGGPATSFGNYWVSRLSALIDDVILYRRTLTDEEVQTLYDLADLKLMIEDAEDGDIANWSIYDNQDGNATIENVFDTEINSNVIQLSDYLSGYKLANPDAEPLTQSNFIARWRMKSDVQQSYTFYWRIRTSDEQLLYLSYRSDRDNGCYRFSDAYVTCGISDTIRNGEWHTITRDLQADLKAAAPDVDLLEVKHIQIRMAGRLDDIQLLHSSAVDYYTISGRFTKNNMGISGESLVRSGAQCTLSDNEGLYQCRVPEGWVGSLTPNVSSTQFFKPYNRDYSGVSADTITQDFAAHPIHNGLLGYWHFNNCDATDNSGNGFDGIIHSEPNCVDGVMGKGFQFDGVDDFIEINGGEVLANPVITVAGWVYKQADTKGVVVEKAERLYRNGENYRLAVDSARTENSIDDEDLILSHDLGTAYDNQWVHTAFVLTMEDYALYVNGELKEKQDLPDGFVPYMGGAPLQIGGMPLSSYSNSVANLFFNSTLDEIYVYNRALSETEIQQLANPTRPVAHYCFDDAANLANDCSGNARHGRLENTEGEYDTGVVGNAIRLDGVNDYVNISAFDNDFMRRAFTITVWFKPDTLKTKQVVTWFQDGQPAMGLKNNGAYYAYKGTTGLPPNLSRSHYVGALSIVPDEWNCMAYTYDASEGNKLRYFLNGFQVFNGQLDQNFIPSASGKGRIGLDDSIERSFDGLIDEVTFYNYALSEEEIQARCPPNPVPEKLVAHYCFDDPDNLGKNCVADGYHGEVKNGAATTKGIVGNAILLDGQDDHVQIAPFYPYFTGNAFTISAWFKPNQLKARNEIVWFQDDQPAISLTDDKLHFKYKFGEEATHRIVGLAEDDLDNNHILPVSEWNCVVYRYDGYNNRSAQFYLNGKQIGEKTLEDYFVPTQTGIVKIGADDADSTRYFNGAIDEVRLYNYAVPTEEIATLCPQVTASQLILEDAESGNTDKWSIYQNYDGYAAVANLLDTDRNSRVLEFTGDGRSWHELMIASLNANNSIFQWASKGQVREFTWQVTTNDNNKKFIHYNSYTQLGCYPNADDNAYIDCGLDISMLDSVWRTFNRDLQADLNAVFPDLKIQTLDLLRVRAGNGGRLDDIKLLNSDGVPHYKIQGRVTYYGNSVRDVSFSASGADCRDSGANGYFTCTVPEGWFGTLVPVKGDDDFTPFTRVYRYVQTKQLNQHFVVQDKPIDVNQPILYWQRDMHSTDDNNGAVHLPYHWNHYIDEDFSVMVFAKPTTVKHINYLFHVNDDMPGLALDEQNRLRFGFRPNGTADPIPTSTNVLTVTEPLPVNEWIHAVATWDSSSKTYKNYLNGQFIDNVTLPYFKQGNRVAIGWDGGIDRALAGEVAEVMLFKRTLSDDEIYALFKDKFGCHNVTSLPEAECNALIDLYKHTKGEEWINNTGWLETNQPCQWYGVTCLDGHVHELILNNNNLVGELPDSFADLTQLIKLQVNDNELTGRLPVQLRALQILHVADNYLSTDISGVLAYQFLEDLVELDLSNNCLVVSDPDIQSLLDSKMPNWSATQIHCQTSYDCQTSLPQGQVACYTFDGDVLDGSGNPHHGIPHGNLAYETSKMGQALLLNGQNYVEIPHSADLQLNRPFSLSFFVAPQQGVDTAIIMTKGVHPNSNYRLLYANEAVTYEQRQIVENELETFSFPITVSTTQYTHIAIVRDMSQVRIYQNGRLKQHQNADYDAELNTSSLFIGANGGQGVSPYRGLLDELRIYNRALSSDEVLYLYKLSDPRVSLVFNKTGVGSIKLVEENAPNNSCNVHCPTLYYQPQEGTPLNLQVITQPGYAFLGWEGYAGCPTGNSKSWDFTANTSLTCTARFSDTPDFSMYKLEVYALPEGRIKVKAEWCDENPCIRDIQAYTSAHIRLEIPEGKRLVGWEALPGCEFNHPKSPDINAYMYQDVVCKAHLEAIPLSGGSGGYISQEDVINQGVNLIFEHGVASDGRAVSEIYETGVIAEAVAKALPTVMHIEKFIHSQPNSWVHAELVSKMLFIEQIETAPVKNLVIHAERAIEITFKDASLPSLVLFYDSAEDVDAALLEKLSPYVGVFSFYSGLLELNVTPVQ